MEDVHGEHHAASSPPPSADLPVSPPHPIRWVPHRKAEIVDAVVRGQLSRERACTLYGISIEEYVSWQRGIAMFGLAGLQVSGTQRRRRLQVPPPASRLDP